MYVQPKRAEWRNRCTHHAPNYKAIGRAEEGGGGGGGAISAEVGTKFAKGQNLLRQLSDIPPAFLLDNIFFTRTICMLVTNIFHNACIHVDKTTIEARFAHL